MDKVTTRTLGEMKARREKIVALTCYDASTARVLNEAGADVLLVGDSVANVKLGYADTLPVTLEDMLHHTKAVRRGNTRALLVGDMPFLSYEADAADAVRQAGRLIKEGGAEAVKVEGYSPSVLRSVRALVEANIPVMGHVGLTPQSVNRFGGHRVQGRDPKAAKAIVDGARALEKAGAFSVVVEGVPAAVGARVARALKIPVIGIGAGVSVDGQILVVDDLLGLTPEPRPKFVRAYADLRGASLRAVRAWRDDVRGGRFPGEKESYV
jgi:3-methyl-2-oxobutanoate hydroxymethyltransferase